MFFVWGDMIPRSYSARGVRGYQAQLTREDSFHLSTSPSPSPARREGGRVPTPKQPFYHHILLCGSLFLVNHAFQPQKLKEVLYNKCSDSPILNILAPPNPLSLWFSKAGHARYTFIFLLHNHSLLSVKPFIHLSIEALQKYEYICFYYCFSWIRYFFLPKVPTTHLPTRSPLSYSSPPHWGGLLVLAQHTSSWVWRPSRVLRAC